MGNQDAKETRRKYHVTHSNRRWRISLEVSNSDDRDTRMLTSSHSSIDGKFLISLSPNCRRTSLRPRGEEGEGREEAEALYRKRGSVFKFLGKGVSSKTVGARNRSVDFIDRIVKTTTRRAISYLKNFWRMRHHTALSPGGAVFFFLFFFIIPISSTDGEMMMMMRRHCLIQLRTDPLLLPSNV